MSFTVQELETQIEAMIHNDELEWYELKDLGAKVKIAGIGVAECVDEYGGEGQGDDYWTVFKIQDRYFRKNGWYDSYNGSEWDGALEEVFPKEVKKIEWSNTKEVK